MQVSEGKGTSIPVRRIIWSVPLEKVNLVPISIKCTKQPPQERRMPISPRGANGKAEDDDIHAWSKCGAISL